MSPARRRSRYWWFLLPGMVVFLLLLLAGYLYFWPQVIENRIRQSVVQDLSDRFRSDVELSTLQIKLFPILRVTCAGLTLRYHGRRDVPPLLQIANFSFTAGISDLLRPVKHIPLLRVQNMLINVPPREPPPDQLVPSPRQDRAAAPNIIVDRVICDESVIRILPKQPGKGHLDWEIHNLVLTSAGTQTPFAFRGRITNGKPKGEIDTQGQFGPWNGDDPGGTPVSGEYRFTDADLGPLPGIAGILSSTGKYSGVLSELQVDGQTDTPRFSLDKVGRPVPLHTDFSATVDGTNGDTYLHPVNATLVQSLIIAEGRVVRMPEKYGHFISIDATVPNGRVQDFLNLAIDSDKPFLTGAIKIKAKLTIPPGLEHAIEKIILDGQFSVDDAKWSNPTLREKLESFSRHAQGKPEDEDVGSSVSDLKGNFLLQDGILHFRSLTFRIEGADIELTGTYALRNGELAMAGHLRLRAKLSQTVTGSKSFFLKAFDPFFEKNGAGTALPIRITGTRDNPVFGVTVFRKTFDKHLAGDKPKL
jgi:AsmA-like C-terminal region